jgi:hypothetical protein
MVRALLAGTKTQTRRVVKPCKQFSEWDATPADAYDCVMADDQSCAAFLVAGDQGYTDPVPCPYGKPGDRLWVRETFAAWWDTATGKRTHAMGYRADINDPDWDGFGADDPWWLDAKWEPSIHMPRRFSRITLEITGVRVEPLQKISEADAVAEGCQGTRGPNPDFPDEWDPSPQEEYRDLWVSINGADSWAANPWVWVIEFKRTADRGSASRKNSGDVQR